MIEIPLSQGKVAIIDDKDAPLVRQYKWYAHKDHKTYYASRGVQINGSRYTVLMHRVILGLKKGEITDHINGNGLDNRRGNLRKCTKNGNQRNVHARWGRSKYRGIYWSNGWVAQIKVNKKRIYLGVYAEELSAAKAYDKAAVKYHGEYANINF